MLGHEPGDVLERQGSESVLDGRTLPVGGRDRPQDLDAPPPGMPECGETRGEIARLIVALPGNAISVEVRQSRLFLGQDAADPDAEALPLEIREMPHVLDEREAARGGTLLGSLGRQTQGGALEEQGCGFEGQKEGFELAAVHVVLPPPPTRGWPESFGTAPGCIPIPAGKHYASDVGIEAIRTFLSGRSHAGSEPARPDPVVIAACALLLEIAHADDVFRPEERERIARHIRDEMGVRDEELRDVFRLAEEERRESVDLYHFTRLVAENLSRDQRLKLVEAIWGVVYSDGSLSEVESHLARRIAELLGFQHPEVQAAKETVAAREADETAR